MSDIQNKIKAIMRDVEKIENMLINGHLTWEELSDWNIGETRNIDGTINLKIWEEHNFMAFKTTIPPGTKFPKHWHTFFEDNFVLHGIYIDRHIAAVEGEWVSYDELDKHTVENHKDAKTNLVIMVIFTRKPTTAKPPLQGQGV